MRPVSEALDTLREARDAGNAQLEVLQEILATLKEMRGDLEHIHRELSRDRTGR